MDWFAYGARFYDSQIGRLPSLDPLADEFAWVSPYNYAENRPINGIDLWGMQWVHKGTAKDMVAEIHFNVQPKMKGNTMQVNIYDKKVQNNIRAIADKTESIINDSQFYEGYSFKTNIVLHYEYNSPNDNSMEGYTGDYQLIICDYIPIEGSEIGTSIAFGKTEKIGNESSTQENKISLKITDEIDFGYGFSEIASTLAEEIGHSAGLGHVGTEGVVRKKPDETDKKIIKEANYNNVMIQGSFGEEFSPLQIKKMIKNWEHEYRD